MDELTFRQRFFLYLPERSIPHLYLTSRVPNLSSAESDIPYERSVMSRSIRRLNAPTWDFVSDYMARISAIIGRVAGITTMPRLRSISFPTLSVQRESVSGRLYSIGDQPG